MGGQNGCNSSDDAKIIARWVNSLDSIKIISCAPPDSCLNLTIGILYRKLVVPGKIPTVYPATFDLAGKKVNAPSRQIIIGKGGKIPLKF